MRWEGYAACTEGMRNVLWSENLKEFDEFGDANVNGMMILR
jgi:hypothetical protein